MSTLIVVILVVSMAIGFVVIRLRAAPVLVANAPRPRPRPSTTPTVPAPVAKARSEESSALSALDWEAPVVDIQAAGGLYDLITLEIFPEPMRRRIVVTHRSVLNLGK